jgi:hypothetical protein
MGKVLSILLSETSSNDAHRCLDCMRNVCRLRCYHDGHHVGWRTLLCSPPYRPLER